MKFDSPQRQGQHENVRGHQRKQEELDYRKLKHKKSACQPVEHPVPQASAKLTNKVYSRENAREVECNMKGCYCQETKPKVTTSLAKTSATPTTKSEKTRQMSVNFGPTWGQILSQHVGLQPSSVTNGNDFRGAEVPSRPAGRPPTSLDSGSLEYDNFCGTACFVQEIAARKPKDLLQLKKEVDRALKNMGLCDNIVTNERKVVPDRPKVVLEYLEELSLEVLKKRLEESELKYSAMRKKTEDVLVTQKLDIQRLREEIRAKNEEIGKLKSIHKEASANSISRDCALIKRIEMLENRLTNSLEKEEKSSAQCDSYKKEISRLKLDLNMTIKDRDLYKAKMEIYQAERDKAISSLSVYEKTFKSLKCELGQEIDLIKPSPNMTADSCGTLDLTGRQSHHLVTSSPNVSSAGTSDRHLIERNRISSTPLTKKKERREAAFKNLDQILQETGNSESSRCNENRYQMELNVGHSRVNGHLTKFTSPNLQPGEDLILDKLKSLASQFKKFSDDVIPMAVDLDKEAKELVNWESSSSADLGTDVDSQLTIGSASTTLT